MFDGLNVALNASDTISSKLNDIGEEAADVSQSFAVTAGSSMNLAQEMDVSEDYVQDMEAALSSIPDDAAVTAEALGHLQNVTEQLGDENQQVTADFKLLESAMSDLPEETIKNSAMLRDLEGSLEDTSQKTYSLSAGSHILAEGLEQSSQEAARLTTQTKLLERELEDIRNDALQAAASVQTFNTSVASGALAGVGINVGPLTGGIKQVGMVIAGALPLILALGAALGGAAVAAVALGGAIAALFAGGILGQAKQMADASEDIEGTMEGVSEIMSQVAEAAEQAVAPLMNAQTWEFALSGIEGFLRWLEIASNSLAGMMDTVTGLGEEIGGAFIQETPEFFSAIEEMLTVLGPMISNFMTGLIRDMPGLIRFLTDQAYLLLPALGQFGDELITLLVPLTKIGVTVLRLLLPALTALLKVINAIIMPIVSLLLPAINLLSGGFIWLVDTLGPLIKLLGTIIGTVTALGLAMFVATNFITLMATGLGVLQTVAAGAAAFLSTGLTGSLYSVAAAAWSALGPLGILLGVLGGIALYYGVFDDMMNKVPDGLSDSMSVQHESLEDDETSPLRQRDEIAGGDETNVQIGTVDASSSGTTEARIRRIIRQETRRASGDERTRETGQ